MQCKYIGEQGICQCNMEWYPVNRALKLQGIPWEVHEAHSYWGRSMHKLKCTYAEHQVVYSVNLCSSIHEINATWCFVEVWESGSKGKQCRKRREAEQLREGGVSKVWLEGKGNSTLPAVHRCNQLDWEVQMFHSQSVQTEWHGCSGQQGKGWSEMRRCRGRQDGSITWRIAEGMEFDHPLMKENWSLPLLEWTMKLKEVRKALG